MATGILYKKRAYNKQQINVETKALALQNSTQKKTNYFQSYLMTKSSNWIGKTILRFFKRSYFNTRGGESNREWTY